MSKVFLSYSNHDHAMAVLLHRELVRAGLQVWMDDEELYPGDALLERLAKALDEVDFVCALVSEASLQSSWARKEQTLAVEKEIEERRLLLVPVLLESVKLPDFMKGKIYADFSRPKIFKRELEKLVIRLGGRFVSDLSLPLDPFNILYTFDDVVQEVRKIRSSKLDLLLVNGGATLPALIGPHLPFVIEKNKFHKLSIRMVLLETNPRDLVERHSFEDGFKFDVSDWDDEKQKRIYEALVWESGCLQTIGIHGRQAERSVATFKDIQKHYPNVSVSVRANSRLPFCRLMIFDDMLFYTPFLKALPFNFFTLKLAPEHPFFSYCVRHFGFLYDSGEVYP